MMSLYERHLVQIVCYLVGVGSTCSEDTDRQVQGGLPVLLMHQEGTLYLQKAACMLMVQVKRERPKKTVTKVNGVLTNFNGEENMNWAGPAWLLPVSNAQELNLCHMLLSHQAPLCWCTRTFW